MGLFLALVGRRVLVTQMLLAVGRKERGRQAAGAGRGRTCPAGSSGEVRPNAVLALGPGWGFGGSFGFHLPVSVSHSLNAIQHFSS